ncbi:MAG: response regulator transcription factor [Chloroflexi bacterium]|nr:response regulator transcription factor [Chloroflexota bacterium]
MAKILVVDDELTLLETLRYNLRREGYEVYTAVDGLQALEMARREKPELIILDIMLPKLDGFEVCRILRKETMVPILMLTAKEEEIDKVLGLELGADDYITKPFSLRELSARIKASLRRVQMVQEAKWEGEKAEVLRVGELELNLAEHRVSQRGSVIDLRPREFELLAFLLRNKGKAFSRDTLLERVWGYDYAGDTRTVDVHIRWLREKIEDDPSTPRYIRTVRGVGYRLEG